jgi:hypothetical protein
MPKPDNGHGKFKYSDGEYDGEWRNGMRHGRGKEVWADDTTYEGEWSEDRKHGRGVSKYAVDGKASLPGHSLDYSWNAGDKYDGGFKASLRHGACTYTFFNGETFNCTWADGGCPEFTVRQRMVRAALDPASAQASAAAEANAAAEVKAAAEVMAAAEAKAAAEA